MLTFQTQLLRSVMYLVTPMMKNQLSTQFRIMLGKIQMFVLGVKK